MPAINKITYLPRPSLRSAVKPISLQVVTEYMIFLTTHNDKELQQIHALSNVENQEANTLTSDPVDFVDSKSKTHDTIHDRLVIQLAKEALENPTGSSFYTAYSSLTCSKE